MPSVRPPTGRRPSADPRARKDLIYGSEIGAWLTDGTPAVSESAGVPARVREAGIPLVRFAVHDTFTDLLDPAGSPGQILRSDFRAAISGIVNNLRAVPWLKLLPITKDVIGTKAGTVWCPPWTGDASGNLPTYKAVLDEVRAVYDGPVIIESNNEMEFACWATWKAQNDNVNPASAGVAGVSKRIGEHYAATMPALKKYGRQLGFDRVVVGGYLGIGGGPQWGQSVTANAGAPYGYTTGYQTRWVNEFNTAVHDAYVANNLDSDFIPDFESIHAYPHGGDFATSATGFDFTGISGYDPANPDNIAYAYYRNWITQSRAVVNSIWGPTVGDQILFAISEWNAGLGSAAAGVWSGWSTAGRPEAFYAGWLGMLAGDGNTTGSGTRYWEASCFELASQASTVPAIYYNLVRQDGSVPTWFDTFKTASLGDPLR